MGGRLWRWSVLVTVICVTSAHAATSLFIDADASHPGGRRQIFWTDADHTFLSWASLAPLRMLVTNGSESSVYLDVGAPNGETLSLGSYSGATVDGGADPLFDLSWGGGACDSVGSFEVLDLVTGSDGGLEAIAIDFVLGCDGGPPSLRGSLRYRSGDPSCVGPPDGTPCDDFDACTGPDACLGEVCVGEDVVTPECLNTGICMVAGRCDPSTAACTAVSAPSGAPCDDENACTTGELCRDDVCGDGEPVVCDDDDPCTIDACDPTVGCVSEPIDGACWATRAVVRVAANASAGGRSAHCSGKCEVPGEGSLILYDDGTYLVPGGQLIDCAGGTAVNVPDEIGVVRPVRRRSFVLEPTNEDALFAAAAECLQEANPFRSYRARLKLAKDGETLRGRSTVKGLIGGRIPVRVKMTAKVRGALVGGPEIPPVTRKPLPSCAEPIRIRCRTS